MFIYTGPGSLLALLLLVGFVYLIFRFAASPESRKERQEAKARRMDPQYWKESTQNQRAKNRELWKNMSKTDRQLYYFGIVCFLLAFLIFAFIGIHAMLH